MALVSYQQKIMFTGMEPIVYLHGARHLTAGEAQPFFAYLILSLEQLTRLNRDMERGLLVRLAEYGRVVLQGIGEPTEDQKRYMERYYAFDHTDYFAEEENDNIPAAHPAAILGKAA